MKVRVYVWLRVRVGVRRVAESGWGDTVVVERAGARDLDQVECLNPIPCQHHIRDAHVDQELLGHPLDEDVVFHDEHGACMDEIKIIPLATADSRATN